MTYVFIIGTVMTLLMLAGSALYWSVYAGTGEQLARLRAVGFFRWAVVFVLGTFNIWIFTRVGGAIKDIWFPSPPQPVPVLIDGQLPGRPPPEETSAPQN
ncbi:MAG TPA: hypothetical protein VFZ28_05960 [Burkholderiaceae bacterium]|nr:hypothetical protein [Burkholderiaceae bacterium]